MAKTLSQRVAEVLQKPRRQKSVQRVADEVGVSRTTIYRWSRGDVGNIEPPELEALAKSLNEDYKWLQFGEEEKKEEAYSPKTSYASELITELINHKGGKPLSGAEREIVFSILLEQVESVSAILRLVRDLEKGKGDEG